MAQQFDPTGFLRNADNILETLEDLAFHRADFPAEQPRKS